MDDLNLDHSITNMWFDILNVQIQIYFLFGADLFCYPISFHQSYPLSWQGEIKMVRNYFKIGERCFGYCCLCWKKYSLIVKHKAFFIN